MTASVSTGIRSIRTPVPSRLTPVSPGAWAGVGPVRFRMCRTGTDQQIGASFDRFERAIPAVLILASFFEVHF